MQVLPAAVQERCREDLRQAVDVAGLDPVQVELSCRSAGRRTPAPTDPASSSSMISAAAPTLGLRRRRAQLGAHRIRHTSSVPDRGQVASRIGIPVCISGRPGGSEYPMTDGEEPRGGAATEGTDVGTRELARRVHPSRRPGRRRRLDRRGQRARTGQRPRGPRGTGTDPARLPAGHRVCGDRPRSRGRLRQAPGPWPDRVQPVRPGASRDGAAGFAGSGSPPAQHLRGCNADAHDAVDVGSAGIETGSAGRNDAVPRRPRPGLGSGAGPAAHRTRRPTSAPARRPWVLARGDASVRRTGPGSDADGGGLARAGERLVAAPRRAAGRRSVGRGGLDPRRPGCAVT